VFLDISGIGPSIDFFQKSGQVSKKQDNLLHNNLKNTFQQTGPREIAALFACQLIFHVKGLCIMPC